MQAIAYYFLQVILCSGLMMGYYLLVLRNKRFHQYNRFYLLTVAILSWLVPLVKIRWSQPVVTNDVDVYQLLYALANSNSRIEKNIHTGFHWSGYTAGAILYVLVAVVLLTAMVMALYKVYRLLKHNSYKHVEDVYLILTKAEGTPFSFFRYIFWNEEIDLRSESGKQILQHEIAHVRQKHSFDKVFIQGMLIPGWFNPFFWLLKKELEMIHEFIADKKAVNNGDSASLAQMLLTAAFPQQKFALTNPFFFSPIKRRLQMLTNNANPRFSYLRRAVVLPLLAVVVILFSFRTKEQRDSDTLSVASVVEKVVSIVVSDIPRTKVTTRTTPAEADLITIYQPRRISAGETVATRQERGVAIVDSVKLVNLSEVKALLLQPVNDTPNTFKIVVTDWSRSNNDTVIFKTKAKKPKPLIVIDGKKMDKAYALESLDIETVQSIAITKNQDAIAKYGEDGADGVISITTKNYSRRNVSGGGGVITGVSVAGRKMDPVTVSGYRLESSMPDFPGGTGAWNKFLETNLNKDTPKKNGAPKGIYMVTLSFLVSETGEISDVRAETDPGYGTKDEALRVIKTSPNWVPLERNGQGVRSLVRRNIIFNVTE